MSLTKAEERATGACRCRHVSVSVQRYSVQYKGTTWSRSPLWKEGQQEVQQHKFISSYIAAYIQILYRVARVHPTGLTANPGCRQLSTTALSHDLSLYNVKGSQDSLLYYTVVSFVTVVNISANSKLNSKIF
jgi:hypothetical protein